MSTNKALFKPLRIGPVEIANRLVMAATAEVFSIPDGLISKRHVYFLREIARGGVGLIIAGNRLVHPHSGAPCRGYAFSYLRENVKRDRVLTDVVHGSGAKIFVQHNHFGSQASAVANDDYRHLQSSCDMKSPVWGETPKPMDADDLEDLASGWADAAAVARESGFDGSEIHMANGYLLHQFLSRIYNQRTDEYGGSLENRMRFPLEVLQRVRTRVGRDFAVGIRLCADEKVPGGDGAAEAAEVAQRFVATGLVDYVGLAGGTCHSYAYEVPPADLPEGWLVTAAARVKASIKVPVIVSGAIVQAQMAARIVATGKADAVAMTRALLADPAFARKIKERRSAHITHCIRCNQGCISRLYRAAPIACTVNPAAGREEVFGSDTLVPSDRPGRWVVVGGGPAGMRAACLLAARGHKVTLYEATARLGGQVNLLLKQPRRRSFEPLIADLAAKLKRCKVRVRLGTLATAAAILADKPDGVVLATGAVPRRDGYSVAAPFVPVLPGVGQNNVVTVWDVLKSPRKAGKSVLVLDDDGTRYAAGTIQFLLERGHKVRVITRFPQFAPLTGQTLEQALLYADVFGKGLEVLANSWVRALEGASAVIYNLYTGQEQRLRGINTYVLACGATAHAPLYGELSVRVAKVHRIGDCLAPRDLDRALYEAELAGRELIDTEARYIQTGALDGWDDYVLSAVQADIAGTQGAQRPAWTSLPVK